MALANDDNVSICVPAEKVVHCAFSIPNTMSSIYKEHFLEAYTHEARCPWYIDPSRVEIVVGLNAVDLRLQFCIGFWLPATKESTLKKNEHSLILYRMNNTQDYIDAANSTQD